VLWVAADTLPGVESVVEVAELEEVAGADNGGRRFPACTLGLVEGGGSEGRCCQGSSWA